MKILVVDDSVSVRKALERILSTRKWSVIATGSAEEALEKLPGSNAALVIADVVMPGMDGFGLCQEIKADARYAQLPVLLISGIVNADVERQAEEVGAAGIAKKPFTPADLFPKIEAALAASGSTSEAEEEAPAAAILVPEVSSPQPALSQGEGLERLLPPLLENAAVHAALFADAEGTCLAQVGLGLDDGATLAVYSRTLASIAAVLGDRLDEGSGKPGKKNKKAAETGGLGSLHLEYGGHSLLITKIATRGTLLLRIKDASSIGVVRYLVRKFVEEEAQLVGDPVLAS